MEAERRDIQVRVLLTPTEFLALRDLANSLGLPQSSCIRMLILERVSDHGRRAAAAAEEQEEGR